MKLLIFAACVLGTVGAYLATRKIFLRYKYPLLNPVFLSTLAIIAALKAGEPLYLLPDMNFGPEESVFVPFYGVQACTVPSLSRFARLSRAKVVPLLARLTAEGYDIEVLPAWKDFPTADALADTALMNLRLQSYIDSMPAQYYWVHKRFKDRPNGETPPY